MFGVLMVLVIGIIVDVLVMLFVVLCKGLYMLFKGWYRLFYDFIGREGFFLEIMCVFFAGFVIFLWLLVVVGVILVFMLVSFFFGVYVGVVVY